MYYKFTYYLQSTIGWSCKQHQLDAKTSHWLEARLLLHDLWLLLTRDKNSKYLYGRDFLAERAYPLWDIRTRVSPLSDVTGILPLRDSPIVWGISRQSESESLLSVSPRCFIDWSAFSRSWRSLSISSLDCIDWSALSLSRFSKASRSSWLSESWGKRNQKPFFENHLWMNSIYTWSAFIFKSWIKIKAYFKHNFPTSNFSMTYVKHGKFFHKCYYME